MIKGIIYLYISPSLKCYVGQTIDEHMRRHKFNNLNQRYSGKLIDNARRKYKPENFQYVILYEDQFNDKKLATNVLNKLEPYYINLYDSFHSGYNLNLGGGTNSGFKDSEETKLKKRKSALNRKDEYGCINSEEAKQKMREKANKPVYVYKISGEYVGKYESGKEAAKALNITNTKISAVLSGKRKQTGGYKFSRTFEGNELADIYAVIGSEGKDYVE